MSDKENTFLREHRITLPRRIIQILSFLVINYTILDFIFFQTINFEILGDLTKVLPILNSPRNPLSEGAGFLEYMFYSIAQGVFPYLIIGIMILLFLFFNRFFCGWLCPIGTIQDGLCGFNKNQKKLSPEFHDYFIKVKYLIIIILLIFIVPLGYTKINDLEFYFNYRENLGEMAQKPIGYFSLSEYIFVFLPNLIEDIWNDADLTLNPINPFHEWPSNVLTFFIFVFYLAVLITSVWYPRFYCRYLCPFGAVGAAVGQFSFLKLSRSPVKCVGRAECGICERVCPKQIKILDEPFDFFTGKGECNMCLKCKEACPYKAITFRFG